MADQQSEPVPGGISGPTEGRARAAMHRRPGMLTFAAVIMFVVAGFEALSAILAFGCIAFVHPNRKESSGWRHYRC
jgi:hypothetical protein